MAAAEAGILGEAMEKQVYDVRGRIGSLARLIGFDKAGFIHMVTYRIFIFVAVFTGLLLLYCAAFNPAYFNSAFVKALILLDWLFFTAQVYAASQVLAFILSQGRASEHINKSFINAEDKRKGVDSALRHIPYIITVLWLLGFAAMALVSVII